MKTLGNSLLNTLNSAIDTFVVDGAVSDNDGFKKSIAITQTTWLGQENSDWDLPENWTFGVPSSCNHAYIPATTNKDNFPIISGNLTLNFTIKNDGCLFIEGTVEVSPEGLIQNEGTIEIVNIGTLINDGKIINNNKLINYGTIINRKLITNGGTIVNDGVLDNEASIHNLNELLNSGFIDTDNEFVGEGNIVGTDRIEFHL